MSHSATVQGGHPTGCYWVNASTGTIQRQCNPLLALALGQAGFTGEHGINAGVDEPFSTFADAQQWLTSNQGGTIGGQVRAHNPAGLLTGVDAIGDFFQRLTQPNTWIRVGEFLGGGVLLYIGLRALTRGPTRTEAVGAGKQISRTVKKVAKAVPK